MYVIWPERPAEGSLLNLDDPRFLDPRLAPRGDYEREELPERDDITGASTQELVRWVRKLLKQPKPLVSLQREDYQQLRRELLRRDATPRDVMLGDWCPCCAANGRWTVRRDGLLVCTVCSPPPGVTPVSLDYETDQQNETARERRQRLGAVGGRLRFRVMERDGFACHYCGRKPPEVELVIDHVLPISRGGTNHPDNLVAACDECNAGKNDYLLEDLRP